MNGDSEIIKNIAGNVKSWAGNWDAIYDNIILRGQMKQEIVLAAEKLKKPQLLESEFSVLTNTAFHFISDDVRQENILVKEQSSQIFDRWKEWLYSAALKL